MAREEPGRASVLPWLGLTLLYPALAVAVTWPLATRLANGIPLGTEQVATVPLFNLWTLAWNVEGLNHLYAGYWQAPIFHPAPNTFALSEPQPLTGLAAAFLTGLGASIVRAYNLILISALALNGLLAAATWRAAGLGWLAAVAGGCLVLVLPFTHQELGVLQLVPLAGVFAFTLCALRFAARPNLSSGVLLALALACAYALSSQTAVFAALVAVPAFLFMGWPHRRSWRAWRSLLAGGGLFLLISSPVLLAQSRATAGERFERSLKTVRQQSARPAHYFKSAWPPLVPVPGVDTAGRPSERAFWPGALRLALALGAAIAGLSDPAWRRLTAAGLLVLAASYLLSLGGHLGVGDRSLVELLRAVPGLAQVRSFFRFALFVQLATVALATLGLELLLRAARKRFPASPARALVASLALLAVLEIRPAMGKIQELPPLDLDLPWLEWILESTAPGDVLAFVPFPTGRSSRDYLGTSQWMYWQMRHWRPMVNGYSGFFPARFRRLKKAMQSFPSQAALRRLHQDGVRFCVVHRAFLSRSGPPSSEGPIVLVPVFRDDQHALDIFELRGD